MKMPSHANSCNLFLILLKNIETELTVHGDTLAVAYSCVRRQLLQLIKSHVLRLNLHETRRVGGVVILVICTGTSGADCPLARTKA